MNLARCVLVFRQFILCWLRIQGVDIAKKEILKNTYLAPSYIFFLFLLIGSCNEKSSANQIHKDQKDVREKEIMVGAQNMESYLPLLKNKNVACVVNQTSMVGSTHLIDTLLNRRINILKIFAPEHGFRGSADAGESVKDDVDKSSGVPIISLYENNKKPNPEQMADIDIVLFDIQDVGARFYTYLSTMQLVMEACAEQNIPFLLLDRPNPNGHIIDGPVLKMEFSSFVGKNPIPILHGMTLGELAHMINGESWLKGGIKCDLEIIPCSDYSHGDKYTLPVPPSPNLPNQRSILLYPHLCLFEGTTVSVGRGTETQFQVIGHPNLKNYAYSFTPKKSYGAHYPKYENIRCFGISFEDQDIKNFGSYNKLNLFYLIEMYKELKDEKFFLDNLFFDKLAGTDELRKQILNNEDESSIRATWQLDLDTFKVLREKYILYLD